jgi:uncharacterized protein
MGEASLTPELESKRDRLLAILTDLPGVAVAFSGGIDSTVVAKAAALALGSKAVAVTADSPSVARTEIRDAEELARRIGIRHHVVATEEFSDPDYIRNDGTRCYFCKSELFTHLEAIAEAEGYAQIAYGANVDDMSDWRPGHRAAKEREVRSPLYEAGMTKPEIREAARQLGLPNWNKPAMACLSSRIPYGTPVTAETLARIEAAENVLRSAGFEQFRVRHHDTVARIEIPVSEFSRLTDPATAERIVAEIKAAGYKYVTLDLQGFRSGSMNEMLTPAA